MDWQFGRSAFAVHTQTHQHVPRPRSTHSSIALAAAPTPSVAFISISPSSQCEHMTEIFEAYVFAFALDPIVESDEKKIHILMLCCVALGKGCSALPLFLCVLAVIKRRPSSSIGQFCFFPLLRHVYTHSPSLSDENRPFAIFINRSFSYFFSSSSSTRSS